MRDDNGTTYLLRGNRGYLNSYELRAIAYRLDELNQAEQEEPQFVEPTQPNLLDQPPMIGSDLNRELRLAYITQEPHPMLVQLEQQVLSNGGSYYDYDYIVREILGLASLKYVSQSEEMKGIPEF